jgi:hypothetical protein
VNGVPAVVGLSHTLLAVAEQQGLALRTATLLSQHTMASQHVMVPGTPVT